MYNYLSGNGKPLTVPARNGNVGGRGFDIQRFGTYEDQVQSHGGSGNAKHHPFGEHAHDITMKLGEKPKSYVRELTIQERKDSGDIL